MTPQAAAMSNPAPKEEVTTTASDVLDTGATATETTPETDPVKRTEDRISPKLQAIIKRERQAVERERSANAKESEIEAKLAAFSARESKLAEFENLKTTNPLKALELLGLSYQDLSQIMMSDGVITPEVQVKRVEDKLDNYLLSQQEAEKRRIEEANQAAQKREAETVARFKGDIKKFISENASRYELIPFESPENSEDLVYDVIDEHYERTKDPETGVGEVLTIAQAADKVEAHFEQKYDKARNLTKVKTLLGRQEQPAPKPNPEPRQTPKTLTNNLSATPSRPKTAQVTDEERVRRAIAFAKGLRP